MHATAATKQFQLNVTLKYRTRSYSSAATHKTRKPQGPGSKPLWCFIILLYIAERYYCSDEVRYTLPPPLLIDAVDQHLQDRKVKLTLLENFAIVMNALMFLANISCPRQQVHSISPAQSTQYQYFLTPTSGTVSRQLPGHRNPIRSIEIHTVSPLCRFNRSWHS